MNLFTNENIHQLSLKGWKKDAIVKFTKKISDKERPFPCIPATMGYHLNHFYYGFVPDLQTPVSSMEFAHLLKEYSTIYKSIGAYTSLIIFYEPFPDIEKPISVEQYEQLFWDQLNLLTKSDEVEWPNHIPTDPKQPMWEFCYHGEQYFMYCATPAHIKRKSRHFPYFMLAITPRGVLERFNSSPHRAAKIKEKIRERLEDYDSISIHPDLNTYGQSDNHEWKQYFLRDEDTTLSKCPFHKKSREQE